MQNVPSSFFLFNADALITTNHHFIIFRFSTFGNVTASICMT